MNCCRYPVDVKAVGLMQCKKQKKYMMAVSWSDRNNVLIYRTFEEFKKFHKVLKRKFPIEGGVLKKSDRSIPKFKDAKLMQRKSRNLSRSMERLKLLETYAQELLKADAKVSQSEDVIQFFKAQTQDLDPSFPENSIIIMPSEMRDGKKDQAKQQNPSVTQPVVSQNYSCLEAYETKDTKNRPFKVAKKEIVEVLIKDMTGWWLVENKDQQIAWFPAPYLEERGTGEENLNARELDEEGTLYYAVRAYKSQKADELSLNVGVVVEVLEKSDNGWWLIWYNERTGYIPSMFLQPYKNPHSKFQTMVNAGLCVSTPNLLQAASPSSWSSLPQRKTPAGDVPPTRSAQERPIKSRDPLSRTRSRSLSGPRAGAESAASSSLTCELDSLSVSSESGSEHGFSRDRKAGSSGSLPGVKQAVAGLLQASLCQASSSQSSKAPHLTSKDRNDSGFEEESPSDSDSFLHSPDSSASVPKLPARPAVQEILQKCSTVTKRAVQRAAPRPNLHSSPHLHPGGETCAKPTDALAHVCLR
ncbi:NADPH oxidase organizer 1 [Trachemys scripta elegans]|uniref:NADPH oxidase organizer 1 n=1 Tax=Trachemys scripta elegans TaxID=31138 RepID=UPI0015567B05|nr:NADPH oxidase organizer 1 [Trachemys scripta elegans]